MVETSQIFTTPAGLLCPDTARATSLLHAHGSSLALDVLLRQAATLVCHAHLPTLLLLCAHRFYRPGWSARVFKGAQSQVELARGRHHDISVFPVSMVAQPGGHTRTIPLPAGKHKLGENCSSRPAPYQGRRLQIE